MKLDNFIELKYFFTYLENRFPYVNIKDKNNEDKELLTTKINDILSIHFKRTDKETEKIGIDDYIRFMCVGSGVKDYSSLFKHEIKLKRGSIELEFENGKCIYDDFQLYQVNGYIEEILLIAK